MVKAEKIRVSFASVLTTALAMFMGAAPVFADTTIVDRSGTCNFDNTTAYHATYSIDIQRSSDRASEGKYFATAGANQFPRTPILLRINNLTLYYNGKAVSSGHSATSTGSVFAETQAVSAPNPKLLLLKGTILDHIVNDQTGDADGACYVSVQGR